ncbi:MAG: hypothetical protein IH892_11710 [Planctomycetes bacterium]|nr:hypothetical protein [Planctomycetota bacterium]
MRYLRREFKRGLASIYGKRLTQSGIPRMAGDESAQRILARLQRTSEPFGTTIRLQGGEGLAVVEDSAWVT